LTYRQIRGKGNRRNAPKRPRRGFDVPTKKEDFMEHLDRLGRDFLLFSTAERAAILEILGAAPGNGALQTAVGSLAKARRRTLQRAASDEATDHRRRTLVGARIPREEAQRYRQAAQDANRSLYAWVREALREKEQAQRSGTLTDGKPSISGAGLEQLFHNPDS
jgi:hypothetical protein